MSCSVKNPSLQTANTDYTANDKDLLALMGVRVGYGRKRSTTIVQGWLHSKIFVVLLFSFGYSFPIFCPNCFSLFVDESHEFLSVGPLPLVGVGWRRGAMQHELQALRTVCLFWHCGGISRLCVVCCATWLILPVVIRCH